MNDKPTITIEELGATRDSICNSLSFLVDECRDTGDPWMLVHAAMMLQIMASFRLAKPEHSRALLEAMIDVAKREFEL